jgi:hypothetical protein
MPSYEERYRLTGYAVIGLAVSFLAIGLGWAWGLPAVFIPIGIILVALTAQGAGLVDLARRRVAFRVDETGVTLGAVPDKLTVRRGSPLFIPWADVEGIVRYRVHAGPRGRRTSVECVGIQRHATAGALRWGNEQAPGSPVPRVATWATRRITGWRLDTGRLAALTAKVAPDVRIIDTTAAATDDQRL